MITRYNDLILAQSTAVRTNVLNEVNHAVEPLKCDLDGVLQYSTNIVQWLKPVIDLSDFYVYPMNGITEGLNWWMAKEHRTIYMDEGDYQWVVTRGSPYDDAIKYMSVPSSIDGNFKQIPNTGAVALDLAYVGSTEIEEIKIEKNVEYVFYSLSKSFGIRNVRTGWYFTRQPDPRLEALTHSAKYYNYYANVVAEKIISNFDIDFVYNSLYNKQTELCTELDIVPSDSVWLATSTKEIYKKFRRSKDIARLCLAGCYNEQEKLT